MVCENAMARVRKDAPGAKRMGGEEFYTERSSRCEGQLAGSGAVRLQLPILARSCGGALRGGKKTDLFLAGLRHLYRWKNITHVRRVAERLRDRETITT